MKHSHAMKGFVIPLLRQVAEGRDPGGICFEIIRSARLEAGLHIEMEARVFWTKNQDSAAMAANTMVATPQHVAIITQWARENFPCSVTFVTEIIIEYLRCCHYGKGATGSSTFAALQIKTAQLLLQEGA